MNIADVIDLTGNPSPPPELEGVRQLLARTREFKKFAIEMNGGREYFRDNGEVDTLLATAYAHIHKQRGQILRQHGTVGDLLQDPRSSRAEPDFYGRLSETPKAKLSSVRQLCDALGFIIIPFAYLDPRSYERESYQTRQQIEKFTKGEDYTAFALCPLPYYSLERHVRSKDPNLSLYPGRHAQAFLSVQMTVPTLRTVLVDIAALKEQVRGLDARITSTELNMQMLARTLETLQEQVLDQQRQIALQRAQTAVLRQQVEALDASRFMALDPLLFVVASGVNPAKDEAWAAIGPCWGPDFEDIALTAIGLTKKDGQRQLITGATSKYWG